MTDRKPPDASFTDWVEYQIREGQKAGKFDNLAGAGKPLADIDQRRTTDDWIVQLAKRENLDVLAMLPPSLALAKELEDLPDRLTRERSEKQVVAIVEDLNRRIREEHRRPQSGPPLRAMPVNVERVVEAWRSGRPSQ
jgi:Domain of unknown function (DUF1992)